MSRQSKRARRTSQDSHYTTPLYEAYATGIPYAIAFGSCIPLIGILLGLLAIALGLTRPRTKGKPLMLIGASGILLNVLLYGTLAFVSYMPGGIGDQSRVDSTKASLTYFVPIIEKYKAMNGHYPIKLEDMRPVDGPIKGGHYIFQDATTDKPWVQPRNLYYKLDPSGNSYYLFSFGLDGVPCTPDDIFPDLTSITALAESGYRTRICPLNP